MELPFLIRSDRELFSNAEDAEKCRMEIARLSRLRRNLFIVAGLLFIICMTQVRASTDSSMFWVLFLLEVAAFQDV